MPIGSRQQGADRYQRDATRRQRRQPLRQRRHCIGVRMADRDRVATLLGEAREDSKLRLDRGAGLVVVKKDIAAEGRQAGGARGQHADRA